MARLVIVEELAGPAVIGRGGHVMRNLQWLHGFARLGHDVLFLEFLTEEPGPAAGDMIRYFEDIMQRYWQLQRSALVLEPAGESLFGLPRAHIESWARAADAVITLMPTYHPEPFPLIEDVRPRVIVESDPAYTHLWAAQSSPEAIYGEHDLYYTVGANIGTDRTSLPTLGLDWRVAWNPIVLDWWQGELPAANARFSTVGDWRGYGYLEFEGRTLGPKAEEFRRFLSLPSVLGEEMDLVLDIDPDDPDRDLLARHGWTVLPPTIVGTPDTFRNFVLASAGEFSCAKGGYVGTHSGWFSDRTAAYLATGRPAVVQATGFEDVLPTGAGLFAVSDVEAAAEAVQMIRADYERHSHAARAIAREYFDSDRVCGQLLAEIGIASRVRQPA